MVHTLTVLTLWLAQALGLYIAAAGLGIALYPERLATLVDELDRSAVLMLTAGATAFWIGTAVLIVHHHVTDPLAVIVTAFGVVALMEGVFILAFPKPVLALFRPFVGHLRAIGLAALIGGVVLFLCGVTGRADALIQGVS